MVSGPGSDGAVGRVTSGDWSGYLLRLERHTDVPESWVLLWRDPRRSLEGPDAVGDVAGDRVIPTEADLVDVLEDLGVEWLDSSSAADAVERYFSFPEPEVSTWRGRRRK